MIAGPREEQQTASLESSRSPIPRKCDERWQFSRACEQCQFRRLTGRTVLQTVLTVCKTVSRASWLHLCSNKHMSATVFQVEKEGCPTHPSCQRGHNEVRH